MFERAAQLLHSLLDGTPLGNPKLIEGVQKVLNIGIPLPGVTTEMRRFIASLDPDLERMLEKVSGGDIASYIEQIISQLEWVLHGDS